MFGAHRHSLTNKHDTRWVQQLMQIIDILVLFTHALKCAWSSGFKKKQQKTTKLNNHFQRRSGSFTWKYCVRKRKSEESKKRLTQSSVAFCFFVHSRQSRGSISLGSHTEEIPTRLWSHWSKGITAHARCCFPTELAWFASLVPLCDPLLLHTVSCCPRSCSFPQTSVQSCSSVTVEAPGRTWLGHRWPQKMMCDSIVVITDYKLPFAVPP